jgi:hypothetical protein
MFLLVLLQDLTNVLKKYLDYEFYQRNGYQSDENRKETSQDGGSGYQRA